MKVKLYIIIAQVLSLVTEKLLILIQYVNWKIEELLNESRS